MTPNNASQGNVRWFSEKTWAAEQSIKKLLLMLRSAVDGYFEHQLTRDVFSSRRCSCIRCNKSPKSSTNFFDTIYRDEILWATRYFLLQTGTWPRALIFLQVWTIALCNSMKEIKSWYFGNARGYWPWNSGISYSVSEARYTTSASRRVCLEPMLYIDARLKRLMSIAL